MKRIGKVLKMGFFGYLVIGSTCLIADIPDPRPFEISVQTNKPGTSTDLQFTIQTNDTDYSYDYDVDCENDGVYEFTHQTGNVLCAYNKAGIKIIKIRGIFPTIYLNGSGDKDKLLDVLQWGDIAWRSMRYAFEGASNLTISASDNPNLTQVQSMRFMFGDAINLTFDYSINDWDVSHVTDMYGLFDRAKKFNSDISDWNVSNVTTMASMFSGAEAFNQPLGNWDVSQVTNMSAIFYNAKVFNQDIRDWNVSNVHNMGYMFYLAEAFNQPLGKWDVSGVSGVSGSYGMTHMFYSARAFNQDIGDWDVSNVTKMTGMFLGASAFNQDISKWNVSNVQTMGSIFEDAHTLSISHYDGLLRRWNILNLQNNVNFDTSTDTYYCQSGEEKLNIELTYGWTISDAGENCDFYIITPDEVTIKSGETYVLDVDANVDEGEYTYHSIEGGADADKFTMNFYGVLQFKETVDVNNPTDENRDNIYRVLVRADDEGVGRDYQTIKVKVVSDKKPTQVPVIMYLLN